MTELQNISGITISGPPSLETEAIIHIASVLDLDVERDTTSPKMSCRVRSRDGTVDLFPRGSPTGDLLQTIQGSVLGQRLLLLGVAVIGSHRENACRVLADHEGIQGWEWNLSGMVQHCHGHSVDWPSGKSGQWDGDPFPSKRWRTWTRK